MKVVLSVIALFVVVNLSAQSVTGKWKSISDETGKAKSIVEISEKDGKIYGRIIELFREEGEDPDPICDECEDDRKDKKVLGMEIIRDMKNDGDEWEDGTICDPKDGKVYNCKLWIDEEDPNKLNVRGYVAFFFRTQYWVRVN